MQPGHREGHSLLPCHREQPVPHHCRELLLSRAEISHSFHWYGKVRLLFPSRCFTFKSYCNPQRGDGAREAPQPPRGSLEFDYLI